MNVHHWPTRKPPVANGGFGFNSSRTSCVAGHWPRKASNRPGLCRQSIAGVCFPVYQLVSVQRTLGSPMWRRSLPAFLALLAVLSPATRADSAKPARLTGVYSNLRFNGEGGDLLGMELLVLPRRSGAGPAWTVVVQIAEGGAPCAGMAPLKVTGDKLEFTLPKGGECDDLHFTGTFSATEIVLRWDSGTVEHLKRGKSYWQ
jgi:hypothetical protein